MTTRRTNLLPDHWPAGFHPLMRTDRRRPPAEQADEAARAWFGVDRHPNVVDVEANADAVEDYQRGAEAWLTAPTALAPPPGAPPELRARHEAAPGLNPLVGVPLTRAQHRKAPERVRPVPADLVTAGYVVIAANAPPVLLVGADPYRKRLIISVSSKCSVLPNDAKPTSDPAGNAIGGLSLDYNQTSPLVLETTCALYVWSGSNSTVTWLAEVWKDLSEPPAL